MIRLGLRKAAALVALVFIVTAAVPGQARGDDGGDVSGKLVNGFRVLDPSAGDLSFTVFRGDYIKFDISGLSGETQLVIPALSVRETLTRDLDTTPYVKMKQTGMVEFALGKIHGTIAVKEYDGANYEAVSAKRAVEVIQTFSPVLLDVRTPLEHARGHIGNSRLIPVQQLQARLDELSDLKDEPILVYCATGNRSTVASKIMIDKGFTRIFNLRKGIADWARKGLPVTK